MLFLAPSSIRILKKVNKILIIIQRSNGDVFLSSNLIHQLYQNFDNPDIDLLVNDDTFPTAKILPFINRIHQFSYLKKQDMGWRQEKELIKKIFRKYDLSINLTASDRSNLYALFASKNSISAIEKDKLKSWWKKMLLKHYYYFDVSKHILLNNSQPLNCLGIKHENKLINPNISESILSNASMKLKKMSIGEFIIFHPSAQYNYKIYPKNLRNRLLNQLNTLGIPILISGSNNKIDSLIKTEIPVLPNIYNFIGETSLEEYIAISQLSMAYIGMDTLNMHIAASQNKRIFAIFGSTKLSTWSPWSNYSKTSAYSDAPIQTYDNVTIFQSSVKCKICGLVGCGSNHNINEFPSVINPEDIYIEIKKWFQGLKTTSK